MEFQAEYGRMRRLLVEREVGGRAEWRPISVNFIVKKQNETKWIWRHGKKR